MASIKLYSAICYDAWQMCEKGFHWHQREPYNTTHYKFDRIEEHVFELPKGVESNDVINVYTEFDNTPLVETSDNVYRLEKEII